MAYADAINALFRRRFERRLSTPFIWRPYTNDESAFLPAAACPSITASMAPKRRLRRTRTRIRRNHCRPCAGRSGVGVADQENLHPGQVRLY